MSAGRDQALTPSGSHQKCLVHKGKEQNYEADANPPPQGVWSSAPQMRKDNSDALRGPHFCHVTLNGLIILPSPHQLHFW